MRLNKILFYFSVIVSLITLVLSICFTFFCSNEITLFISGVLLNVFAGTVVLIATTIFDYFLQRRKLLTAIMNKILKLRNKFSKIKYLSSEDSIPTFKQYKDYCKKESKLTITKKDYEEYKKGEITKIKEQMEEVMDTYLSIADIDFEDYWLLWDELYFLKPFDKNKKRKWFHKEIFGYAYDLINDIREQAYHFKIYKNEFKNYRVNYEKITELQKKIFHYEELDFGNYDWSFDIKENSIRHSGSSYITEKHYVIINKVEEHLTKMFDEIGKINYFDKNYNGREKAKEEIKKKKVVNEND
ncbi:MAG: hypothetical protein ACK5HP_04080 [Bacilli bacterium]